MNTDQEVAWLCEDLWDLPCQLSALGDWINLSSETIVPGTFSADIAFSPRSGAAGGGAGLPPEVLGIMSRLGMALYLSEYPEFVGEE